MSALYVRDKFREWCNDVAAVQNIPFYDTVNREQNPVEDLWFTCEFFSEFFDGTFCKPGYIETGFIRLVVKARSGTGDNDAISGIELLVPEIFAKVDPTQRLVLQNYEPVTEDSFGSAERFYNVSVAFNYKHML